MLPTTCIRISTSIYQQHFGIEEDKYIRMLGITACFFGYCMFYLAGRLPPTTTWAESYCTLRGYRDRTCNPSRDT